MGMYLRKLISQLWALRPTLCMCRLSEGYPLNWLGMAIWGLLGGLRDFSMYIKSREVLTQYHVGNAETNVDVKMMDGDAGWTGATPGGYVAAIVLPVWDAKIN